MKELKYKDNKFLEYLNSKFDFKYAGKFPHPEDLRDKKTEYECLYYSDIRDKITQEKIVIVIKNSKNIICSINYDEILPYYNYFIMIKRNDTIDKLFK